VTEEQIRERLAELVRTELRIEGALPQGTLADHLDSVQRLTLVVAIEDAFRICLLPEDEAAIVTMEDVVSLIHTKLQATKP